MTEAEDRKRWCPSVSVELNEKFFHLEAYSGYSLKFADPEATPYLLAPDVEDKELGQALLATLKQSRFLPYEQSEALFGGWETQKERYQEWVQMMMKRYGYKTKGALFKNMKSCSITQNGNMIEIHPTWHERLQAWSGEKISKDDYVHIAVDRPPEELGAALRLAFSRCK